MVGHTFLYNKDASANNVKSVIKPKRIFKNTGMQFPPLPPPPLPNKFDSLFIQGRKVRSNSLNAKTNTNNVVAYPFLMVFFAEIFPIKSSGSFFYTLNSLIIFICLAILVTLIKKDNIEFKYEY